VKFNTTFRTSQTICCGSVRWSMLRPLARNVNRCVVIHCRHSPYDRQIHTSSVRSIDDESGPSFKPKSEQGNRDESEPNNTPPESGYSLVDRLWNTETKSPEIVNEAKPNDDNLVRKPIFEAPDTRKSTAKLDDFILRANGQEKRVNKFTQEFSLRNETGYEHRRRMRSEYHDRQTRSDEEANERGKQVFEEINRERAGRGEPPLSYVQRYGQKQESSQGEANESESQGFQQINRRRAEIGEQPPFYNQREERRGQRSRGRLERGRVQERRERQDKRRLRNKMRWDEAFAYDQNLPYERHIGPFYEKEPPKVHQYEKTFDPSRATVMGVDEVDIELSYGLGAKVPSSDDTWSRANSDGSMPPVPRTIRNRDRPSNLAGAFLNIHELGPVSGFTYYTARSKLVESERTTLERVGATSFPEGSETDVEELHQIRAEIESGMEFKERELNRKVREAKKALKLREETLAEGTNRWQWAELVPLPSEDKPETFDIDDYVAPVLTHKHFRYRVPAVPYGVQGRAHAAETAAAELTELFLPPDSSNRDFSENTEPTTGFRKFKDELIQFISSMKPPRPIGRIQYTDRVQYPRKIEDGIYGPNNKAKHYLRPSEIEEILNSDQRAVWKKMHQDHFIPKSVHFPVYKDPKEYISKEKEEKEGNQRIAAFGAIEKADAAALKKFRRYHEYEIRNLRRRLGLPIAKAKFKPLSYQITELTGICNNIDRPC
jgi:hypothetical protein